MRNMKLNVCILFWSGKRSKWWGQGVPESSSSEKESAREGALHRTSELFNSIWHWLHHIPQAIELIIADLRKILIRHKIQLLYVLHNSKGKSISKD